MEENLLVFFLPTAVVLGSDSKEGLRGVLDITHQIMSHTWARRYSPSMYSE